MADELTRRAVLGRLAAAAAALALPRMAIAQGGRRPNVVFFLIDDLKSNALSCLGHPFLKTPRIDRIAHEGALFRNAFVNISLCSPSRACFLTGCEPQRTRVFGNEGEEYDHRVPTIGTVLQEAGYHTGYVGKWHQADTAEPRPGWDYWLSFKGQGQHENPALNENGTELKRDGYMSDILTEYAVNFLKQPREANQPFCLYFAHKAVHGPFIPAPRHKGSLEGTALPEPANFNDDLADKPWWQRANLVRGARKEQWEKNKDMPVPEVLPDREWNPATGRAQLEMMGAVDESIGQVLQQLEAMGELDNTIVVFSSDNGYFHGEHRRGDKRLHYEESIRIPLLVRYPPLIKPGSEIGAMSLNIDLCPTLLDLCGAPLPEGLAGRSWRPLLKNPGRTPDDWRQDFLYQYFEEGWMPGLPDLQGVRTERYKFVRSPEYPTEREFYDLQTDPYELTNLAGKPEVAELEAKLEARLDQYLAEAEQSALPTPPPPPTQAPQVMLWYQPKPVGDAIDDRSGNARHGRATGLAYGEVDGHEAWIFTGQETITVDPKNSPPTQNSPFYVRVICRPTAADGVILSHGGQTHGYSLELVGGKPIFYVRSGGTLFQVAGPRDVVGGWHELNGYLASDGSLRMRVDIEDVAKLEQARPHRGLPNEGLTVGADTGTRVGEGDAKPFVGAISDLEIGTGDPAVG